MIPYQLIPKQLRHKQSKYIFPAVHFLSDTAILTHATSTPLTSLLFSLQQLSDKSQALTKEQQRAIKQAQLSANYLKQFFNTESTNSSISFCVAEMLQNVVKMFNSRETEDSCKVAQHIAADLKIYGSAVLFQEMMVCILNNAFEARENASTKCGVAVTVNCWQKGDQLVVQVLDNGCGIEWWKIGSYFASGRTSKANHQGIGLSFVKNVVTKHFGGSVSISSNSSCGTQFTVLLPLCP
ncbi:MAG: HAMP domain-containing histidine kinase [bacterium]|nr:HAMP domain-containing histidine kinase [bacterium]